MRLIKSYEMTKIRLNYRPLLFSNSAAGTQYSTHSVNAFKRIAVNPLKIQEWRNDGPERSNFGMQEWSHGVLSHAKFHPDCLIVLYCGAKITKIPQILPNFEHWGSTVYTLCSSGPNMAYKSETTVYSSCHISPWTGIYNRKYDQIGILGALVPTFFTIRAILCVR